MKTYGTTECHQAGSVLFSEGDPGDCAYLIESGTLEVSTSVRDERLVLRHLGPGDIIGEMAIIDDAPRSATALVIEDATLRVIQREQLQQRLKQADPVLHMLMRLIAKRYRCSLNALKCSSSTSVWDNLVDNDVSSDLAVDKFRMETDLRSAVADGELTVVYQPIVDLRVGRFMGFEALLRWQHPRYGIVPPDIFISLAEETDLISEVDAFVLKRGLEDIKLINGVIGEAAHAFVCINVSPRHLADTRYLDVAQELAGQFGVNPALLTLELTESQVMDKDNATSWIGAARKHGFGVALDDFGTGYSSLSQLLALDVDTIKIDQSFVHKLGHLDRSEAVVRGIIALAGSMQLSVIAEGIETQEQKVLLGNLGCMMGQGYALGRPVGVDEIFALIRRDQSARQA